MSTTKQATNSMPNAVITMLIVVMALHAGTGVPIPALKSRVYNKTDAALIGREWVLDSIRSFRNQSFTKKNILSVGKKMFVFFSPTGGFFGNDGCNMSSAEYKIADSNYLFFLDGGSTCVSCSNKKDSVLAHNIQRQYQKIFRGGTYIVYNGVLRFDCSEASLFFHQEKDNRSTVEHYKLKTKREFETEMPINNDTFQTLPSQLVKNDWILDSVCNSQDDAMLLAAFHKAQIQLTISFYQDGTYFAGDNVVSISGKVLANSKLLLFTENKHTIKRINYGELTTKINSLQLSFLSIFTQASYEVVNDRLILYGNGTFFFKPNGTDTSKLPTIHSTAKALKASKKGIDEIIKSYLQ